MINNKTAMFFTISALSLLAVVFAYILFQAQHTAGEGNEIVSVKANSMNTFITGLEEDLSRALFIAGFGAILAVEGTISTSYQFVNDSKANLAEAVINGTINGNPASIMSQRTLPDWRAKIEAKAAQLGILVNLSFDSIGISQTSPWAIDFMANITYNITDTANTAVFYGNKAIDPQVSIIGFEDPIYTVFSGGKVVMGINSTPYEGSYASETDTTNLKSHINQLFYANSTGPDFLMRLEGRLENSSVGRGIESIVPLPDFQAAGLPVYERSSVDYIYFGNSTQTIYKVNQTFEDWLRLDEDHLKRYQVYELRK